MIQTPKNRFRAYTAVRHGEQDAQPEQGALDFCEGFRFVWKVGSCWSSLQEAELGQCESDAVDRVVGEHESYDHEAYVE